MSLRSIEKGVCKTCKGKRSVIIKDKEKKCPACKGTGIIMDQIIEA